MPLLAWISRHHLWALGIGVLTLVLLAAAGVWFFLLRTPATQVDLRQALRLYRQTQNAEQVNEDTDLPPTGVYEYRTSGGEQLSFAGISRSFPADSDMIVTDVAGCSKMIWEPLVQHTEGWVVCPQPDGALGITSTPGYEEIAGTQTTTVIHCPVDMYFVPPHPFVGERWQATCRSPGEKIVFSGEVLGTSSLKVGGLMVPALHTHLTLTFSGAESGTNPNDIWVSSHDGLILSQHETVDLSQKAGPFGSVRYTEQMTVKLESMSPVR